jgi:two-component system phosphate regulon response regulator OmpR
MVKVLVVDDEAELRGLLQRYLGDQGCQVRTEPHAETVAALLARERFDVLVLDLMMPGEDGLSLCRRLRHQGETIPILMLTARGDPVDRVVGLEMGADDYLAKPFHPRELLARIQALVRRQQVLGAHRGPAVDTVLRFGPYALNLDARSLTRDGQAVPLTTGEFQLLQALALNPRRPLGRDRLIELAHGREHDVTDRAIDSQIMRLRKLIETQPSAPRFIQTVWGVGYVFTRRPEAARMNWPRTLVGRHALLLVGLLLLGQLLGVGLVSRLVFQRVEHLAELAARQVEALQAGLAGLPLAQRQAFVARFNRNALAAAPRQPRPARPGWCCACAWTTRSSPP